MCSSDLEAILLVLLDKELLPELKLRQASQMERLTGFVASQIAPVPIPR